MKSLLLYLTIISALLISQLLNSKEAYAQVCDPFGGARNGNQGLFTPCTTSAACADPYICVNRNGNSNTNGTCMTVQQCTQGVGLQNQAAESALGGFLIGYGAGVDGNTVMGKTNEGIQRFVGGGNGGGIQTVMNMSVAMYKEQPASSQQYFAYLKYKMDIPGFGVEEAYAQSGGFGFASFSPILRLWEVMRNIALIGFTLVFIVIGFMIMLRKQIDARTVVSIQQAIPKLVISLVLVIFSYGIFAVLVDFVTLGTRVGAAALQIGNFIADIPGGNADQERQALDNLLNANVFKLWDQLYNVDGLMAGFNYVSQLDGALGIIQGAFLSSGNLTSVGGSITRTVIFIAMFVALLRTFFLLLTSYLMVTFRIIFSPFIFLMMAIPGASQGGFMGWIRGTLAHLLVFPTVFFMLALAAIFATFSDTSILHSTQPTYRNPSDINPLQEDRENIWRVGQVTFSPTTPYWTAPGLGDFSGAIGGLLALGVILTVPKAGTLVREAVQYKGSQAEGEAGATLQKAAGKIPFIGSMTRF